MRKIFLSQNKVALVDDTDYEELSKYKWFALKDNSGNFYAGRNSLTKNGNRHQIYMHRQILGLERNDFQQGDHRNHNTLDNQRSNLRVCTCLENQRNQKIRLNTSSRFKGVCWHKASKKWLAGLRINGKTIYLGVYVNEMIAALIYDIYALRYFGEFAYTNFGQERIALGE